MIPPDDSPDDSDLRPHDAVVLASADELLTHLRDSLAVAHASDSTLAVHRAAMYALLAAFALPTPPVESFATGTDDAVRHYAEIVRRQAREATTEPTPNRPILILQALVWAAVIEAQHHGDEISSLLRRRSALLGHNDPSTGRGTPGISTLIAWLEAELSSPRSTNDPHQD